jgi:predicted Rossmann-fold nucleotide-binding protein
MIKLYTLNELLDGLTPNDKMSYIASFDFKQYAGFVKAGGAGPRDFADRSAQAQHDAGIAHVLQEYVQTRQLSSNTAMPLVGVMGSHSTSRKDRSYRATADLCRRLAREGFLIATGGGPGAMEAAHVGAWFADSSEHAYLAAFAELSTQPDIPKFDDLLDESGVLRPGKEPIVEQAHDWLMAAMRAKDLVDKPPRQSVAIATWLYGAEPTMPFATVYAKYFQNSIREEALVHGASAGIVYAKGGGGTIREIFQDVEQNYYARSVEEFTPMIFADPDGYWERDATFENNDPLKGKVLTRGLKLDDVMRKLFSLSIKEGMRAECLKKVRFTLDHDEVVNVLRAHSPSAEAFMAMWSKGIDVKLLSGRFSR